MAYQSKILGMTAFGCLCYQDCVHGVFWGNNSNNDNDNDNTDNNDDKTTIIIIIIRCIITDTDILKKAI